ncbi:hypothetical protein OG883_14970 [Streptomyces sp. NBC_01142]|uniref:hypothetical protein n=1 Tax=Streptomyces sp. NBC_01142 TaxID=2975865 RepID=UPI002253EE2D|nr:hypothetical protein [Streptomyces sp. NBC_01142]MCX4821190.1 hypothetical protein [Streptomyces sp. NBC_01142]
MADRPVRIALWRPRPLTPDDMLITRMKERAVHSDDLAGSVGIVTPTLPQSAVATMINPLSRPAVCRQGATVAVRPSAARRARPGHHRPL